MKGIDLMSEYSIGEIGAKERAFGVYQTAGDVPTFGIFCHCFQFFNAKFSKRVMLKL